MSLNSSKLTIIITIFAFFDLHPQSDYFIKIQLYIKYMIIMIETRSHINKASKWNICLDNHAFQQSCQNYSHWKNDSPIHAGLHSPRQQYSTLLIKHIIAMYIHWLCYPLNCWHWLFQSCVVICNYAEHPSLGTLRKYSKSFQTQKKVSLLLR